VFDLQHFKYLLIKMLLDNRD